jgi:hypothetical protein
MGVPLADTGPVAKVRWAVPCSAHRKNGLPCSAFAVTGGTVCVKHGGATPQVKAAAARRWELELMMRRIERRSGPLVAALMRAEFPPDPATYRSHKSAEQRANWTPRFIPVNLDELAREHGRGSG